MKASSASSRLLELDSLDETVSGGVSDKQALDITHEGCVG